MRCLALLALVLVTGCAAAPAEEEPAEVAGEALTSDVLKAALAAGEIGETPTGYLAIIEPAKASDALARTVQDNFIKRKALYTQVATSLVWTTVQDVGKRTACTIYDTNIPVGNTYKTEAGVWTKRTEGSPVIKPSWCLG